MQYQNGSIQIQYTILWDQLNDVDFHSVCNYLYIVTSYETVELTLNI